jgi:protease I
LKGYKGKESIRTDRSIEEARPDEYTAMLIPGGHSPDHLRADDRFVAFVRAFDGTGAPIAAVCHGPQLLMSAELVRGRALTAWKTIQADLRQMGALVRDEPVVVDNNWITSRQPSDLDAFSAAFLRALGVEDRGAVSDRGTPEGGQKDDAEDAEEADDGKQRRKPYDGGRLQVPSAGLHAEDENQRLKMEAAKEEHANRAGQPPRGRL